MQLEHDSDHRYDRAMEPASTIIKLFGGPKKVATIVGVHPTRASNWMRPRSSGGTGGTIPFKHVPKLLSEARDRGIPLEADDFLPRNEPGAA